MAIVHCLHGCKDRPGHGEVEIPGIPDDSVLLCFGAPGVEIEEASYLDEYHGDARPGWACSCGYVPA